MTRDGDEYVDLDDRVTMARDANASLFISVHADTLSEAADVSGSTVYTVRRARFRRRGGAHRRARKRRRPERWEAKRRRRTTLGSPTSCST